jgi:hypothetical protein
MEIVQKHVSDVVVNLSEKAAATNMVCLGMTLEDCFETSVHTPYQYKM